MLHLFFFDWRQDNEIGLRGNRQGKLLEMVNGKAVKRK